MDDLSSLIGEYYEEVKPQDVSSEYRLGQIVYVPTLEIERRCLIGEVRRGNDHSHDKVTLQIRKQNDQDFVVKKQRLPIKALELGEGQEIVLSKAKMRPCLILGKTDKFDIKTLPVGTEQNKALNAMAQNFILAPMYSVSTPEKVTAFGPTITARIKCLMYPQFFHIPVVSPSIKKESILRLDHCFVNPLAAGINSTLTLLKSAPLAYVHEQLKILIGHKPSDDYLESRELLLELLPDEYKENSKQ